MNITQDQIAAAEHGEPIGIRLNGTELVLIRRDVYEKLQSACDSSDWTEGEIVALANHAFDDADTAGPIE